MRAFRGSISQKLTAINMLVSGTAVLLACAAFFTLDLNGLRVTILNDLTVQAQIIGANIVSPLVFDDPATATSTLSALRASPHILYAGIYDPSGRFFAGYWRNNLDAEQPIPLPAPANLPNHWMRERQFAVVQPILFQGNTIGTVYIRSDTQALAERMASYVAILLGILVVSLGAAWVVSRMAQRVISEPLGHLAGVAQRVSRDKNYALRARPARRRDEIGLMTKAFNDMLAEIQKRDSDLQESERQFRSLADSVPQLAWMGDPDGSLTWYNQRWYEYTGRTPEDMRGWGWQSVHDPNRLAEVIENWRDALAKGRPFQMVFPLRGRDGSFREFLTLALPVYDAQGKIVRWFGTNTDITEQLRSEEALRRSEKLAATGRLAASIAHEINNPLEAVTNLLYLARKNPAKAQGYLVLAEQELERIAEITRHTLGFYRDTSQPVRVQLSEVLRMVLELYNRKLGFKKISVRRRFGEDIEVTGFPGEIRQIFANLVSNAIEAMAPGGQLTIKASAGREWGNGHRMGVRVSLMDTGTGMESEQMSKIFDAFYTTKQDTGTGLGLWLTKSLVSKHRGTVRVRSTTRAGRHGTVFSIFFPNSAEQGATGALGEEAGAREEIPGAKLQ